MTYAIWTVWIVKRHLSICKISIIFQWKSDNLNKKTDRVFYRLMRRRRKNSSCLCHLNLISCSLDHAEVFRWVCVCEHMFVVLWWLDNSSLGIWAFKIGFIISFVEIYIRICRFNEFKIEYNSHIHKTTFLWLNS